MNRIDQTFKKNEKLLSIYFSAGHPELEDTLPILEALQDSGVDEDLKKSCGRPGLNGGYFDNPNLKFGVNCYGVKDSATDEEIALSHRNSVGDVVDQLENDSASQEEDTDVKKYRELRANGEISRNNFKCGSWNNHNVESD